MKAIVIIMKFVLGLLIFFVAFCAAIFLLPSRFLPPRIPSQHTRERTFEKAVVTVFVFDMNECIRQNESLSRSTTEGDLRKLFDTAFDLDNVDRNEYPMSMMFFINPSVDIWTNIWTNYDTLRPETSTTMAFYVRMDSDFTNRWFAVDANGNTIKIDEDSAMTEIGTKSLIVKKYPYRPWWPSYTPVAR